MCTLEENDNEPEAEVWTGRDSTAACRGNLGPRETDYLLPMHMREIATRYETTSYALFRLLDVRHATGYTGAKILSM